MTTSYEIVDGPKMLRETLCLAQTAIGARHPGARPTGTGWPT